MRGKVTRWSVLAWVVLWLAVIAPGHERGKIRTDSSDEAGLPPCCASHAASKPGEKKPSKDENARHCALCYLNASLDLPVFIDLSLHLFGLLERLPAPGVEQVHVVALRLPICGRAPPTLG